MNDSAKTAIKGTLHGLIAETTTHCIMLGKYKEKSITDSTWENAIRETNKKISLVLADIFCLIESLTIGEKNDCK